MQQPRFEPTMVTESNTAPNERKENMLFNLEGKVGKAVYFDCNSSGRDASNDDSISSYVTKSRGKSRGHGPGEMLPEDFIPSSYTVIVGRGKRIAQTVGNQRLKILAKMYLPEYADAKDCKTAKTRIVNKIVDAIKSACTDNGCEGAFVRFNKGLWYVVDDSVAREKVGYQLRDLLGDKYESSSRSKVAKKHRLRQQTGQDVLVEAKVYDVATHPSTSSSFEECHPMIASARVPVLSPRASEMYGSSPMSMQNLSSASRPHHIKCISFDAMHLLNQPLIHGRDSFTW